MALKPQIVHVVGHTEAHHAATADDVIAACTVARRAIENLSAVRRISTVPIRHCAAQRELIARTQTTTLAAIRQLAPPGVTDPLLDPPTLARAVTSGILDAPHLRNNAFGRGAINTHIIAGACVAVDAGGPLPESERIAALQ